MFTQKDNRYFDSYWEGPKLQLTQLCMNWSLSKWMVMWIEDCQCTLILHWARWEGDASGLLIVSRHLKTGKWAEVDIHSSFLATKSLFWMGWQCTTLLNYIPQSSSKPEVSRWQSSGQWEESIRHCAQLSGTHIKGVTQPATSFALLLTYTRNSKVVLK